MKAIFPIVIFLLLFSCNNQPKQPGTVAVDTTVSFKQIEQGETKRTSPPLGMQNQKEEGMVMGKSAARALAVAGEQRNVLENKDTQIITTTSKSVTYVETDITVKKYNPGPVTPPVNKPPTANAGIDKSITLPINNTSLAGVGTDLDGTISSYLWTRVSGGAATIGSSASSTTGITGLVQGEYLFRLTVKDNGGLTATDDVKVTVNPAAPIPSTGYLALPPSGKITARTGQVIENLRFENMSDIAIRVGNVSNVTIRNCFFNKTGSEAIEIEDAVNVTIENCLFNRVTTGVYALSSQTIKVINNEFVNVRQRSIGGRGQFVQFNGVSGAGNQVENNRGENFAGESDPEDMVSMFQSYGTASSPISIRNNTFRGGGPSTSGGGIILGDYGGQYQIAENNKLLNPGQYGMAIAGGRDCKIVNNMIVAKQQSFTNNPLYMWAQQGASCGGNTVSGNKIWWIDKAGSFNGGWDAGNCGGSNFTYPTRFNSYADGEAALAIPTHFLKFVNAAELLSIRK